MVMNTDMVDLNKCVLAIFLFFLTACSGPQESTTFHDPDMDFAALQAVAVMPFENLSRDKLAAERVRDTFMNNLLSTSPLYVIPPGEVARGIDRAGIVNPTTPSAEEILKLAVIIKANAVITGVVREYGEVRSGSTPANLISISAQMHEVQTGTVVWTASSTKGGITMWDRLFGGGGQPMNDVTEAAVDDLIEKLFTK
jgi:hypothetical protein